MDNIVSGCSIPQRQPETYPPLPRPHCLPQTAPLLASPHYF
ncbi:hypothetical protein [Kingella sp. (in: b-proteobacteria)]|nr:hypothetical protein [Kingella sp. (in: b-proteobacteria)]MDO4658096.1 hypothetical protein [Kingella sp. (in: b-proteobacteria)]